MNHLVRISCALPIDPEGREVLEQILCDILEELGKGDEKYGPHPGPKRAFGALRNEFNELRTEQDAEDSTPIRVKKECIQVGAMAIKYLRDVCHRRTP